MSSECPSGQGEEIHEWEYYQIATMGLEDHHNIELKSFKPESFLVLLTSFVYWRHGVFMKNKNGSWSDLFVT